jgi:hypothetical protein
MDRRHYSQTWNSPLDHICTVFWLISTWYSTFTIVEYWIVLEYYWSDSYCHGLKSLSVFLLKYYCTPVLPVEGVLEYDQGIDVPTQLNFVIE